MRICIASGTYHPDVGGPPTYLRALAKELVHRGHGVKVVTHGRPGGDYPYPIHRIPRELPAPLRLARFGAAVLREARGADLLYVNDYGLPPTVTNLLLRKPVVMKIVGDFAWEYAVRHDLIPRELGIDEFQRRRFTPAVERLRLMQTWYARRADLVITPSQYLSEIVVGWGVARGKVRVIPNAPAPVEGGGLLCDAFERWGWSSATDCVVVTVARLAPWKGIDVLIESIALARKHDPNLRLRLLVLGDGDERERLERLAEPLDGSVRFAGEVDRWLVGAYLRLSSIVAICSAYEGLSHVLLEAMAERKPIVATRVGGNVELIRDGQNGLLVPYGDAEALSSAITRLAGDHELKRRLGQQARTDVAVHSWPHLVDATLAAFEEALAIHGNKPSPSAAAVR